MTSATIMATAQRAGRACFDSSLIYAGQDFEHVILVDSVECRSTLR
jgi:hypothetical protein